MEYWLHEVNKVEQNGRELVGGKRGELNKFLFLIVTTFIMIRDKIVDSNLQIA
jgi:hypothetical protein